MNVEGRNVGEYEALERGGDYCVKHNDEGEIVCVYAILPGFGSHQIIPGPASPTSRTKWEIAENDDGTVTVSPSLLTYWHVGDEEKRFHAFLKAGIWEVLDDTVGAVWTS